jgi:TetR/AcrR family transcriptional repressor of lmrAB and yxaGH operons
MAIMRAAAELFHRQGFSGTGLNEIGLRSGANKGSLYHFFPNGKPELGAAVVTYSGKLVETTLTDLAEQASDTSDVISRYVKMLSTWLRDSRFRRGNPITTMLLEEAPGDRAITAAGLEAYDAWISVFTSRLIKDGVAAGRARRVARLIIAGLDGALVQARVQECADPLFEVAEELQQIVTLARSESKPRPRPRAEG